MKYKYIKLTKKVKNWGNKLIYWYQESCKWKNKYDIKEKEITTKETFMT